MIFEHYIEDLSIKILCLQGMLKTREHDKEYITDGFLFPESVLSIAFAVELQLQQRKKKDKRKAGQSG